VDFLQFEDIQQFAAMKQSLLLSGFPVAQGAEVLDAYWLVIKRSDHIHLFRILTPLLAASRGEHPVCQEKADPGTSL
jgi:hypothetical protein